MTYKEFKVQKALGTIDYLIAARTTKSSRVLHSIITWISRTLININTSPLNTFSVVLAVVNNPHTNLNDLEFILTFPFFDSNIQEVGVHNPKVNRITLEHWMSINNRLNSNINVRRYLYQLQIIDDIPEEDRIIVTDTNENNQYTYFSPPQSTINNPLQMRWIST